MAGTPLALPEREEIHLALIEDRCVSWAVMGRRVGRHPTTVARDVRANGGRDRYRPATAERAAEKARARPRPRRLAQPGPLRDRVTAELKVGRSPEAIWADLVAEDAPERVCVETIYTAAYAGAVTVKASACLRMRRPRRRSRLARNPNRRPGLPNIARRPAAVNDRTELGHWEADQAARRAVDTGELLRAVWDLGGVALALGYDGKAAQADAAAAEAERVASLCGSPSGLAFVAFVRGELLVDLDPVAAEPALARAVELAASVDASFVRGLAEVALGSLHARHGGRPRRCATTSQ